MSATVNPPDQRAQALQVANQKRLRKAELRKRIRTEQGALADVLLNPPADLAGVPLIDVIRLAYSSRSPKNVERLGRMALGAHVNLMMPLGAASLRSREWCAVHAVWHWSVNWAQPRICVVETDS